MLKLTTRALFGLALLAPLTALAAEPQGQSPLPATDAANADAAQIGRASCRERV